MNTHSVPTCGSSVRAIRPAEQWRRRVALASIAMLCASTALTACGGTGEAIATSFTREGAGEIAANPFMASVEGPSTTAPLPNVAADLVRVDTSKLPGGPTASAVTTTTLAPTTTTEPAERPTAVTVQGAGGTHNGDTPGLYGGTRNSASCDATKMVAFLSAHPEIGTVWAGVLGIAPDGIGAYVATLTPAVLRADTAVTNHGLKNGTATTIPAVLQAGTAVLVDAQGRPAVKCACGNPLTAPTAGKRVYTGSNWKGFSANNVSEVTAAAKLLDELILVDLVANQTFARPVGNDGDADIPATVPPVPDSSGSTTTMPDGSAGATTTPETTITAPVTAPDTTTTLPTSAATGEDVVVNVTNVGGDCAGIPADPLTLRFTRSTSGGSITFELPYGQPPRVVPIQADGSFADEVSLSPPGLSGGTATIRWSGRVESGSPLVIGGSISSTVTGGPGGGSCDTNFATPTTAPSDDSTTTTTPVTTTIPATTTTTIFVVPPIIMPPPAAPTEGNWYFTTSVSGNSCTICDVQDGGRGRLRIHDSGGADWTVTWLFGRNSRTLPIRNGQFSQVTSDDGIQTTTSSAGGAIPSLVDPSSTYFAYSVSYELAEDLFSAGSVSFNADR